MTPEEAIELLNRVSGSSYILLRRLQGGETGAFEIVNTYGVHLVTKWNLDPLDWQPRTTSVILSERLRSEAGWPVPRQFVIDAPGCQFTLQSFAKGIPIQQLTHSLVDTLLGLHVRRLGLARPDDSDSWAEHLIETLVHGGQSYCLHGSLRSYDDQTQALINRIESIGRALDPTTFAGSDIVHWDLHPGNVLSSNGRIASIIDCEYVRVGDAAFDLVTLAVTSTELPCEEGVSERLWAEVSAVVNEDQRKAYISHVLLRAVDWAVRRNDRAEVELWLAESRRLLP